MSKHKKLAPELRFPEFTYDGIDWKKSTLNHYLTESRLSGNKGDVANKITVKLWGNGVYAKEEHTKGSPSTQYYRRKAGQFIYSKLDFLNQAFGIIPKSLDNYESTVDLPCFDVNSSLDIRFLLNYVLREDFYKKFGEIADGGRKAKRIQVNTFLSFPVILPMLREQQKIADCLSSVDEYISKQNQKIESLQKHKNGLIQKLFPAEGETVPKIRFGEFTKSEKWNANKICDLAKVTTGNKDTQDKVDTGQYPFFVRSQNVERINSFSRTGEAILTSGDGVGVGKNFHYINGKFDFHQRVYCIYDFTKIINGKFCYYYFSKFFSKRVVALSAKNSVDSVRMSMITEMPILLPDIQEQQKIADCLTSLDELIIAETQKLEVLKTHKKGLMQQLFPAIDEVIQ